MGSDQYIDSDIMPGIIVKHLYNSTRMNVVWIGEYLGDLCANCEWPVEYDTYHGRDNMIYRIAELRRATT